MGREIKRVPLDFDWPLKQVWKGYINPYNSQKCFACECTGYNPETKKISDDWYDFEGTGRKWCHNITQDEVDALIESGRLMDFTHTWKRGEGWKPIEPQPEVTAEMVNEWSRRGMGHDAINRSICVRARAERLGVFGYCPVCDGEGKIWFSEKIKKLADNWYDNEKYEPPKGEGWQVWETVSEGSPVSSVFETKNQVIEWLVSEGYDRKGAEKFVETEFSLSFVSNGNQIMNGIDALGTVTN